MLCFQNFTVNFTAKLGLTYAISIVNFFCFFVVVFFFFFFFFFFLWGGGTHFIRKYILLFFTVFKLLLFHNNIAKNSELLIQWNMLKTCIQTQIFKFASSEESHTKTRNDFRVRDVKSRVDYSKFKFHY